MSARNWSRLDEDTGVLIRSIELVKIPLTFYQASLSSQFHRFKSFNGAGKRSLVCDALLCLLCDDDLLLAPLGSENSWAGCVAEPKRSFEKLPASSDSFTHTHLPTCRSFSVLDSGGELKQTCDDSLFLSLLVKAAPFFACAYLLQHMIIHSHCCVMDAYLQAFFHTECAVTQIVSSLTQFDSPTRAYVFNN